MKKLLLGLSLFFASVGLFALDNTLDVGINYGTGSVKRQERLLWSIYNVNGFLYPVYYEYLSEYKVDFIGLYAAGDMMFNEKFGLFADVSLNLPVNTELKETSGLASLVNGFTDNNYESTVFLSEIFGAQFCIPLNEKLNLKFGAGLDFALVGGKNESGWYYNFLNNRLSYLDLEELFILAGLGHKVNVQYFFNEKFGVNAGLVIDWYFTGVGLWRTNTFYGIEDTTRWYEVDENTAYVRPEIGVTFKFGN
ncbi:MAG: hypothetical protein K6F15_06645 [Treponema sp.]|nr:hypothetical protein [Treponema sp.]